jgi:hypothetical protein
MYDAENPESQKGEGDVDDNVDGRFFHEDDCDGREDDGELKRVGKRG